MAPGDGGAPPHGTAGPTQCHEDANWTRQCRRRTAVLHRTGQGHAQQDRQGHAQQDRARQCKPRQCKLKQLVQPTNMDNRITGILKTSEGRSRHPQRCGPILERKGSTDKGLLTDPLRLISQKQVPASIQRTGCTPDSP